MCPGRAQANHSTTLGVSHGEQRALWVSPLQVKVNITCRGLDGTVYWSRLSYPGSTPLWFTVGAGEVR